MSAVPGMPDFWIKAGDRMPIIQATLATDGVPINITGATVKFVMSRGVQPGGTVVVNATATIVDAPNGVVSYSWAVGDTATPGDFLAAWKVTFANGLPQTFPTDGANLIRIDNNVA